MRNNQLKPIIIKQTNKLLLLFLATSLFFGSCSKDYYEDDPLPQNSQIEDANPTTKSTYSWDGHNCTGCGLCITPNCPKCTETCICTCRNARCPVCKGCLAARVMPSSRSFYCEVCLCDFLPQSTSKNCFLTAMYYTARMIGGPGMSIDEIRKLSGYELDYGVTTDLVPTIMRNVFGNQYFGNVNDGSHNPYKGLLDTNSIIITNYPVVVDGKTFAHAVVIVGYVETGNGPKYTCLDPGTGEYIYKTATDLYWFLNSNKFTVAVKKYN